MEKKANAASTDTYKEETSKSGGQFKIPKKKQTTAASDVQMHSPLSRLSESEYGNGSLLEKHWPQSTGSKHRTRCRDLLPRALRNSDNHSHIVLRSETNSRCELWQRSSDCCPEKLDENSKESDKNSPHFPSRRYEMPSKAVQKNSRFNFRHCNKRKNENWNNSSSSSEEVNVFPDDRKRRHLSTPEQSDNCIIEEKNLRGNKCTICSSCRVSKECCPCRSKQNSDKLFQEDASVPLELETPTVQLHRHQTSPLKKKQENIPACPLKAKDNSLVDQSKKEESTKVTEHITSQVLQPNTSTALQSDSCLSAEASRIPSPAHIEGSRRTLRSRKLRNSVSRPNVIVRSLKPVEPIVLSSDDEESCSEQEQSCGIQSRASKSRHAVQPAAEVLTRSKTTELMSVSSLPPTFDENELEKKQDKTVHESPQCEPKKLPVSDNRTCLDKDTAVEIEFSSAYIGNMQLSAGGCAVFKTGSIMIPLEASENKNCLTVETSYLKGYGVWDVIFPANSKKKHGCLVLLLYPKKFAQVLKELSSLEVAEKPKCKSVVVLQMNQKPDDKQTEMLNRIMAEAGDRNATPGLCKMLSIKEVTDMMTGMSGSESMYIRNFFRPAEQKNKDLESGPAHSPQENLCSSTEPEYTVNHQRVGNHYAVSLVPKCDQQSSTVQNSAPVQRLIIFPPPPAKGGLAVTSEDLACLQEGEFLNDVIIDFYLKYLLLKKAPQGIAERSHVFSSFFYRRLTRKENSSTEESRYLSVQHRRHQRVKTWTRHVDIFTKDFIFVPVNEESHWYLALICFPWLEKDEYDDIKLPEQGLQKEGSPSPENETEGVSVIVSSRKNENEMNVDNSPNEKGSQQSDSLTSCSFLNVDTTSNTCGRKQISKRPCILIMDSLKASSQDYTVKILREYLQIEWEVKRNAPRKFNAQNMKGCVPRVPKQDNSSDCGLYLLQYVESFLQRPISNFEFPVQLTTWFHRSVIKNKRKEIHELIMQLHKEQC
ncbi:sentrin-specific protease 7 isoform X2 [Protopterus annectens]|uniref:sentrin-specific protease 7 isoform X2 n=1 Tax=Protopterus annectens TaxID=7888 RepID=UPI001CFAFB5F|nr:sentrin-specific protease 7 isoform X2 [Protopterus annectens]